MPTQENHLQPDLFIDSPQLQHRRNNTDPGQEDSTAQADTFEPSIAWESPIALANKIGAIRGDISTNNQSRTLSIVHSTKTFALTLPSPLQLKRQLDLFLLEFDDYSPYFRRSSLQKRIATALHALSYAEHQTTVHVTLQYCSTFAILCSILATAEVFSYNSNTMDLNTGQHWYRQGKWLMQEFEEAMEDSLDIVVYHMISSGYLMEAERLRPASLHVVRASHAALCIGLNDKTRWKPHADEIVSRPCLWWVLYFLEKRIHWKCGIAYLLRPSEINVDDSLVEEGDTEIDGVKLELIESMISYSRLWASIWQDYLAPNAQLVGNWTEIQLTDARIMIAYHQIPPQLIWETSTVEEDLNNGVTEASMRRRLQTYLVSSTILDIAHSSLILNHSDNNLYV